MKELLCAHSYLDTTEPNVSDPFYIAIMILVLNAASTSLTITGIFPPFVSRHHQFLKELYPDLIPELDLNKNSLRFCYKRPESSITLANVEDIARSQFDDVLVKLKSAQKLTENLLKNLIKDLELLKSCDCMSGPANFLCACLKVQLMMLRIQEKLKRQTPTSELSLADESVLAELNKSISLSFLMEATFCGLPKETLSQILENRCLLSGLLLFFNLLREYKSSNGLSKVEMCQNFVRNLNTYMSRIRDQKLDDSRLCCDALNPLFSIEASKVTLICKFLHPALSNAMSSQTGLLSATFLSQFEAYNRSVKMAKAVIISPKNSDRVESFMAGLVLALRLG